MQHGTITVHPSLNGAPTVHWELDADAAETVLTLLARAALSGGPDASGEAGAILDDLANALHEAETMAQPLDITGCAGLWPDAEPLTLTSPAVLGNDTGDLLAVLLPGNIPMLDAIDVALDEANAAGANLDRTDTSLMADYHPARWVLLHACEKAEHDFHPELAPQVSRTPGAVLVTQVDFTHIRPR